MNYMKQVAEMLGVELNETFCIKGSNGKYKITEENIYRVDKEYEAPYALYDLLKGTCQIEKPILDKKEKEYLENVIRPFKDRVVYIRKTDGRSGEWIVIFVDDDIVSLPCFREGTMYRGMELEKQYSLKELGLFEDE